MLFIKAYKKVIHWVSLKRVIFPDVPLNWKGVQERLHSSVLCGCLGSGPLVRGCGFVTVSILRLFPTHSAQWFNRASRTIQCLFTATETSQHLGIIWSLIRYKQLIKQNCDTKHNTTIDIWHLDGCQVSAKAREFYISVLKIARVEVSLISSWQVLFIKLTHFFPSYYLYINWNCCRTAMYQ